MVDRRGGVLNGEGHEAGRKGDTGKHPQSLLGLVRFSHHLRSNPDRLRDRLPAICDASNIKQFWQGDLSGSLGSHCGPRCSVVALGTGSAVPSGAARSRQEGL